MPTGRRIVCSLRRAAGTAICASLLACAMPPKAGELSLHVPGGQTFTRDNSALAHDAILDIAAAPAGEIWVATAGGITIVGADSDMKASAWHGRDFCHQVVFAPNGDPWVHCSVAKLSTFDGASWSAQELPVDGYSIADIAFDGQQRPWVATNLGLFARIDGDWQEVGLARSGSLDLTAVSCVAFLPGHYMLAHVAMHGLVRVDIRSLAFETVFPHVGAGCPLRVDAAGVAWFATDRGLFRLVAEESTSPAGEPVPFTGDRVLDIAFDAHDRVRISTRLGGIFDSDGKTWVTVAPEQPDLADEAFGSLPLAFDAEGTFWVGGAVVHYFLEPEGTGLVRVPRARNRGRLL